jgi:hypothetical protein
MTIDERLNRLERSNRRLKTFIMVFLCVVIAIVVMGAASTAPKILDVQKLILRDEAGEERGELFTTDKAWGLVLYNKDQTKAASIFVSGATNGVMLSDQNGNVRQSFTSDLNGSEWNIFRPESRSAQFNVIDNSEGTAVTVRDKANVNRVQFGVSSKGVALTLSDADGGVRSALSDSGEGISSFTKDGSILWTPGWDKFSPEEKAKIQKLVPKMSAPNP